MKTALGLIGAVLFLGSHGAGGQDAIIKQRAKELRDQNNVRQGLASPAQTPQPASAGNSPAAPALSSSLAGFQTDLAGIQAGSQVPADQQEKLSRELRAAAQGNKPSPALVNKLVADLTAAFSEKPLSASSRARFVLELDAVLNPAKYPQAKLDGIFRDIQAIFQDNGLARNRAMAIADGVKAISAEIRSGEAR
jgi:hypothetical protein